MMDILTKLLTLKTTNNNDTKKRMISGAQNAFKSYYGIIGMMSNNQQTRWRELKSKYLNMDNNLIEEEIKEFGDQIRNLGSKKGGSKTRKILKTK